MGRNPREQLSTIGPINPDPPQLFACPAEPAQEKFRAIPILGRCCGDDHGQEQAHRINEDMPLSSRDLFAGIIPAHTRYGGRFDTLTIETASGWVFVPACLSPHRRPQRVMNALPRAIIAPAAEIIIHTLPMGVLLWEHPPLDTAHDDIHEGIDDLAHI
jgi:hypothetical protein